MDVWLETHETTEEGGTWEVQRMYWIGVWERAKAAVSRSSSSEVADCHDFDSGWEYPSAQTESSRKGRVEESKI